MLHGHFQIWVKKYNKTREALYEGNRSDRRQAKHKLCEFLDEAGSATLFDAKRCKYGWRTQKTFPHPCAVKDEELRKAASSSM